MSKLRVFLAGSAEPGWRKPAAELLQSSGFQPVDPFYPNAASPAAELAALQGCDLVLLNACRPSWGGGAVLYDAHSSRLVVAFDSSAQEPAAWLLFSCVEITTTLSEAVETLIRVRAALAAQQCPCGCGAKLEAHCWRRNAWEEETLG